MSDMSKTPPISIQFCFAMKGVIQQFLERHDMKPSRLARNIFGYSDGLKSILDWDGYSKAPSLETIKKVEAFLRLNFAEDAEESERLYQELVDIEIRKQRPSLAS